MSDTDFKGPLRLSGLDIVDADGTIRATVDIKGLTAQEMIRFGRRVVACVTACRDSDTKNLERLGPQYMEPLIDICRQEERSKAALQAFADIKDRTAEVWASAGIELPPDLAEASAEAWALLEDALAKVSNRA